VPTADRVFCANYDANKLSVIDCAGDSLLVVLNAGSSPIALAWDSVGNRLYCASEDGDSVFTVDCLTNAVLGSLPVGSSPAALGHDRANRKVYCANRGSDDVTVIACDGDTVVATIGVGTSPVALAWNPAYMRTYVACYGNHSVAVIRDSVQSGIVNDAAPFAPAGLRPSASVSGGRLLLLSSGRAAMVDLSGRHVADLRPGANDIRHLPPGVYAVITPDARHRERVVKVE
jgi:YVTN family beta-propeller protein